MVCVVARPQDLRAIERPGVFRGSYHVLPGVLSPLEGVGPDDLDVIELHDAFTIEELLYVEAMGLCGPGEGADLLARGATGIGGRCAVSPSGGLLAMGHPIGCSGARIVVTLLHEMVRRKSRRGLATLCVSGGLGGAMLLERSA